MTDIKPELIATLLNNWDKIEDMITEEESIQSPY